MQVVPEQLGLEAWKLENLKPRLHLQRAEWSKICLSCPTAVETMTKIKIKNIKCDDLKGLKGVCWPGIRPCSVFSGVGGMPTSTADRWFQLQGRDHQNYLCIYLDRRAQVNNNPGKDIQVEVPGPADSEGWIHTKRYKIWSALKRNCL